MPDSVRRFGGSTLFWPVTALVALLLLDLAIVPGFFSLRIQDGHLYGSLVDILKNGAPTALIALGMTLVIATRGIDLSVGATVAIAGSVACTWIAAAPDPTGTGTAVVAVLLAVALSLVLGLWNGFLVSVLGIQPIIATLVLMTAGRGIAMLITDGQIITVANPAFAQLGGGFVLGLPLSTVLTAVLFVAVVLLTRRTALGMLIESVGINPTAGRLAGIRSRGLVWGVYVFVALCAALAGLMISSNVTAADANNAGLWIELDAILAVVIGGTLLSGGRFSIGGTLVGALILQTLTTTVYAAGIAPEVTLVFKAVVIIIVCLLQSPKVRTLIRRRRDGHSCRTAVPSPRSDARRHRRRGAPAEGEPAVTTTAAPEVSTPPARRRMPRPSPRVLPVLATFVLFVLLFGAGSLRYDNFFSGQVLLNLFVDNAYLIVLAVGMTFVILTGGIDLSVGSVVALSGVLTAKLLATGWAPVPVMVLVLVVGLAFGLAMGAVIHHLEIQPFVVTLAGMFLARGLCYVISVESIPIQDPLFTAVAQAAIPLPGDTFISPSVVIAVVVVAVAAWVLHCTRFGRTVYAVGGNQHSALLMGLKVARTRIGVYAISGFCSALSGLLFTFYSLSGYSLAAVGTELDAIAATVIGGTLLSGGVGLVLGSLLGVLVLGLIQTFISFEGTLSSWWTKIVIGALLLVFVVLQRIFARRPS